MQLIKVFNHQTLHQENHCLRCCDDKINDFGDFGDCIDDDNATKEEIAVTPLKQAVQPASMQANDVSEMRNKRTDRFPQSNTEKSMVKFFGSCIDEGMIEF